MALALLMFILSASSARFSVGPVWYDTDGNAIQAHGGGILLHDGTYYWYGENKSQGYNNKVGVSCYSSRDPATWRNEGVVLPKSVVPEEFRDEGVCERPKVIFNPATGKYVMWMHLDAHGYRVSEAGVAVADHPTGPFQWVGNFRPVESSTFRDMNLFVDGHSAYVFYAGEENQTMHVVRLNREFTGPEEPMVEGKTWARILVRRSREAPAPFEFRGRYYLITSGCTGWAPNAADVAVAENPLGPWKSLGNPFEGEDAETSFHSQSAFILPVSGHPGAFIYIGDRWNKSNLGDSRYIWLPMTFDGDRVTIRALDSWDFSVFGQ